MPSLGFGLGGGLGGDPGVTRPLDNPAARTVKQLLPSGPLWNLETDSKTSRLLVAVSDEFARASDRSRDLIEEADPRTATETLEDWERVLGLPDDVVTEIPATVEGQRLAVTQKSIARGGQTPAFFVRVAAACGYTVTIEDQFARQLLRANSRCTDRCFDATWAYAMRLTVSPPTGAALTHAQLEAAIRRVAPSHIQVTFTYL